MELFEILSLLRKSYLSWLSLCFIYGFSWLPKLCSRIRSLLSFDGDYLKHDCFHVASLDAYDRAEKGNLKIDSQHEMFRISISGSRPYTHGPAFVEVSSRLFWWKSLNFQHLRSALCLIGMVIRVRGRFFTRGWHPYSNRIKTGTGRVFFSTHG
jgi:hypothetical protein